MQVKVIIGTISFMLVMIILAVIALFEPARLQETTEAFAGRQIEKGAVIFRESCVECHGTEGKAQNCVTYAGEEKTCIGMPLNHIPLLCGDPSQRMTQMGWESSKEAFIRQTIAAGRPPTEMPTWAQEFGGPMEDYQIDQVTAYILNWAEDPALCGEDFVAPTVEWPETWEELPEGDAAAGEEAYQTNACFACHGQPDGSVPAAVGPDLTNIANDAAERVDGMSAEQYIYEAILDPNAFITAECPTGPCAEPSQMRLDYGNVLDEQGMADLIAYYMTLTGE
ncbi:MAG: c-type cytochrome [Chloroflexota bacterium]|nr:MAG: c-type cytochrome [Chloroflexota bacterium]